MMTSSFTSYPELKEVRVAVTVDGREVAAATTEAWDDDQALLDALMTILESRMRVLMHAPPGQDAIDSAGQGQNTESNEGAEDDNGVADPLQFTT